MKSQFKLFTVALIILISCSQQSQGQTLDSPKAFLEFKNNNDVQLIDVRTADEVSQGYIAGAKHFDYYESDFQNKLLSLDKNKPVMVYCAVGGRSGKAASLLVQMGFKDVHDLDGGINAWKTAGLPLQN